MRTFLCGGFAGIAAAVPVGAVLATNYKVALADKVVAVVAVAVVVTVLWWILGVLRAIWRWFSGRLQRRRVLKQRRKDLEVVRRAAARAADEEDVAILDDPISVGEDDATVLLDEEIRRRDRVTLSRAQIAHLMQEAAAATHRGDFRAAVELFSDAIDGASHNAEAHLARGRVHLDLGDYNRAMSDFVAAEDLEPDSPEPPVAMGELYFARKDYARAIGSFDIALRLAPSHAMAFCRRGLCYFYRKNFPLALEDLYRAQRLDPDIPNLGAHIAATQRKMKEKKGR